MTETATTNRAATIARLHLTKPLSVKAVIRLFNLLIVSSLSCGLLFSWPVAWSEHDRSYYSLSMVPLAGQEG